MTHLIWSAQHEKESICNLRTAQALISLCMSAGWSGPSLAAYRINGYCSTCWRTENAQIRLRRCARWSGPLLSEISVKDLFKRYASYVMAQWAATWGVAPSDQSHRWRHEEMLHPWLTKMRPVKILIRLRECAVWCESSLCEHVRRYMFAFCRVVAARII